MGRLFLISIFLCTMMSVTSMAQEISKNKKAQAAYGKAAIALRDNKLTEAVDYLEQAISNDPQFATAYQQLGDIQRRLEDYQKAKTVYLKVLEINPNLTPQTHYGLGESYLFSGEYKAAQQSFSSYLQLGKPAENIQKQVEKYLADIEFSLSRSPSISQDNVRSISSEVNTSDDEYFPQLTADNSKIIFTRKTNNQENFYESSYTDGSWSTPEKLQGHINSEQFNEGAHCISPDGKYLFFTGCNWPNGLGSCDIYISKKENGLWSEPFNIGGPINTRGWEAQPSISADGKTLYFVSNRTGGFGGYDLWKSKLMADGQWSSPINLGPNINTPFNEGAPYIHADNKTLYFSSDGWPGFGKKDLYSSKADQHGNWTKPVNLGPEINNHYDQLSIHVSIDGEIIHFASRTDGKDLNIYSNTTPNPIRPNPIAFIKGTILDAESKMPLTASIRVTEAKSDSVVFEKKSDPEDGQFIATLPVGENYAVHIQKEGYLFNSKQYDLESLHNNKREFVDEILLNPIKKGNTAILNNIYFDVDKYDLLPQSIPELGILTDFMKVNNSISIELSGHTDNTGNKESNQKLSENRAKAVFDFLLKKGIPNHRIKIVGYGDTQPITDNSTPEGRQKNRRTEIKIL